MKEMGKMKCIFPDGENFKIFSSVKILVFLMFISSFLFYLIYSPIPVFSNVSYDHTFTRLDLIQATLGVQPFPR